MGLFTKFKDYLAMLDITKSLVLALVAKAIIFDVSYASAFLIVPILGYEGYKLYLKSKTPDPIRFNSELQRKLEEIQGKLSTVSLDKSLNAPKKWHG